ncbi:hypothetical protein HNY73_021740 [Argiope bruennichi]|uniref:Uncharacterized protein n=1 Tax=Argiope bruennichi TaxID=94029 RepID=A0A8T0E2Q1_ARGBR|nr:hypothetical protein HNY73_021740 [Argiope bruennichi]
MILSYFRRLLNAIFQQDNARLHVALVFWPSLDTSGILLFLWSPDLSLIENSGHGLLRDWPASPLQLIRLMSAAIDLKQHGRMSSCYHSRPYTLHA